jgi:hypothetical protein
LVRNRGGDFGAEAAAARRGEPIAAFSRENHTMAAYPRTDRDESRSPLYQGRDHCSIGGSAADDSFLVAVCGYGG